MKEKNVKKVVILIIIVALSIFIGIKLNDLEGIRITEIKKDKLQAMQASGESERVDKYETLSKETGKVIIKYLDEQSNEIAPQDEISGIVGTEYEVQRRPVEGYVAYGEEPIYQTGNFTEQDTEVIYVYKRAENNIKASEEDNKIKIEVLNEKETEQYNIKILTKTEAGEKILGAAYKVTDENNQEIRTGVSIGESFVIGTKTMSEVGEDTFVIDEIQVADGYKKVVQGKITLKVIKEFDEATGKYTIEIENNNKSGVTAIVQENDVIITIINEKVEEEKPTDKPDDKPTDDSVDEPVDDPVEEPKEEPVEEPVNKNFDLSVEKYIDKVVIDNGKKVITKNRTEDEKKNMLKIEIPEDEIEKTKIEVTYEIRVKNIGEVAGYVKSITDYIPENMRYTNEYNIYTKVEEDKIIIKELQNTLLEPNESKSVYVTFEMKTKNDNIGEKTNNITITKYSNDENIEDVTNENTASEKMIVSIKTGGNIRWTLYVLIPLIVIACAIQIIRKKIKQN